jgi:hypothetical protein
MTNKVPAATPEGATEAPPEFVVEDAPAVAFGKPKAANAYVRHIAALIENAPKDGEEKGKAITFAPYQVEGKEMDNKVLFDYVVRKLRPEIPAKYTLRTLLREDGRITLWLVPKIVRTSRPKEETVIEGPPADAVTEVTTDDAVKA